MPITQSLNSKANIKKTTNNDLPFAPAQPILNSYYGVSSAGQTSIANLGFSVDTVNAPDAFFLFVDGRKLRLGSANDYTFAGIAADGTSSAVSLNYALPSNLNIQAYKMGLKSEAQFLMDNRFTSLYEAQSQGFQAFINNTSNLITATTTVGTPAAGTFYSSITGRAALPDLTQDLKPRFGVDRIPVQYAQAVQGEFGPNGEPVYSILGDTQNLIRLIGNWTPNLTDTIGSRPQLATGASTDGFEVTFYGTGLNFLGRQNSTNISIGVSVDGGTASVLTGIGSSNVLSGRNVAPNQVWSVASGLSLGIHTVKVTFGTSTGSLDLYGVEIITTAATMVVNPGVGYAGGQKLVNSAQALLAYNAAVTGTLGGRVLVYQSAAGSVGTAFTPAASSPLYGPAAVHSNEELYRTYRYNEFGVGRSDDFTIPGTGSANLYFTLDDGTTTLSGQSVNGALGGFTPNTTSSTLTFTFVGTGIDFNNTRGAATNGVYVVTVDGVIAATYNSANLPYNAGTNESVGAQVKIASGLPYGTHIVQVTCTTAAASSAWYIGNIYVYQPLKPALPAGAIELADYNVMANYVANSVSGATRIAQGVLRKNSIREFNYSGTWSATAQPTEPMGINIVSTTVGDFFEYSFWGTGFEYRFAPTSGGATTHTVTVDGSTNLSAFTTSVYGTGATFTASTGLLSLGTTTGTDYGLSVSGLSLGLHKIRVTKTTGANNTYVAALDVITPIHSYKFNSFSFQNTGPVGSQGISDNRKFNPVKDSAFPVKSIVSATALANTSTSTTSAVPMSDSSVLIKTSGGVLKFYWYANIANSAASNITYLNFVVDDTSVVPGVGARVLSPSAGQYVPASFVGELPVGPGVHKVDVYWSVSAGTSNADSYRTLVVEEK